MLYRVLRYHIYIYEAILVNFSADIVIWMTSTILVLQTIDWCRYRYRDFEPWL